MNTYSAGLALVISACLLTPIAAQHVSDPEIEKVIKCGLGEARCDEPLLTPGGFSVAALDLAVEVLPPLGRVYFAARDAKAKYKKFTRADVTEEMLSPVITVRARHSGNDMNELTNIEHIVILPRRKKDGALQPAKMEDWNFEAKNLMGASLTYIGKSAQFNVEELPPGELDVVILSDRYGEVRAAINKNDRRKLDEWTGVVRK